MSNKYIFSVYIKVLNIVVLKAPWWRFWNKNNDTHTQYRWKRVVLNLKSDYEKDCLLTTFNSILERDYKFADVGNIIDGLEPEGNHVYFYAAQLEQVPSTDYIHTKGSLMS